jgi:hypothetical protein
VRKSISRALPIGLALVGLAGIDTSAQKPPELPALLKLAGDYVVQYAHQLGTVVADEEFTQYETSLGRMGTPKRVNSQIVLIGQDDGSIGSFRDVVGIDSKPVRPKDDRLPKLFKTPTAASVDSAQEMTEDAVNAYMSQSLHVLDKPLYALDLLRAENQGNYTFKIESSKTVNGVPTVVVKFNEKGKSHLMKNASAVGRYWIEPSTGAVEQTELGFAASNANIQATVTFAKDAQLGVLVPSELSEKVEQSSGGTGMGEGVGGASTGGQGGGHQAFEGHATYAKYRRAS